MSNKVVQVPVDAIKVSGDNMRLDVGELDELAASITEHGILQPLVATETKGGLTVVCGHRRLAAARRSGLHEVPVIIREFNEDERLLAMTVENIQRKPLTALEEARAFNRLVKRGFTQDDVAARIGKSQFYVSCRLALLKLPRDIQQKVHKGEMTLTEAVDMTRNPRGQGPEGADHRGPAEKWQYFWIDKLVRWLESGSVNLNDDHLVGKLVLLGRALKAVVSPKGKGLPSKELPQGIRMCNTCGTVVGVDFCCDDHGDLCAECKGIEHGAAA